MRLLFIWTFILNSTFIISQTSVTSILDSLHVQEANICVKNIKEGFEYNCYLAHKENFHFGNSSILHISSYNEYSLHGVFSKQAILTLPPDYMDGGAHLAILYNRHTEEYYCLEFFLSRIHYVKKGKDSISVTTPTTPDIKAVYKLDTELRPTIGLLFSYLSLSKPDRSLYSIEYYTHRKGNWSVRSALPQRFQYYSISDMSFEDLNRLCSIDEREISGWDEEKVPYIIDLKDN